MVRQAVKGAENQAFRGCVQNIEFCEHPGEANMITEKGSITASSADNNDMTVSQLFEVWLKSGGETSRKNTPRNYFFSYVTYLAEPFGSRRVNDISYEEWRAFKKKLSTVRDTWTDEVTAAISKRILFSFF